MTLLTEEKHKLEHALSKAQATQRDLDILLTKSEQKVGDQAKLISTLNAQVAELKAQLAESKEQIMQLR